MTFLYNMLTKVDTLFREHEIEIEKHTNLWPYELNPNCAWTPIRFFIPFTPKVTNAKISQKFEISLCKYWKTNSTMWKYCQRGPI